MGFLDFNLLDLLDIFLVSTLLYQLFKLVRGTVAIKIFIGLALTYLFWKLVGALQMEVLSEILGQFIGVGV
ncbi:MAG: TIGR00159 family protein, partial [Flavobacteriales bacterium]|nr:TIGR00159 family protein [Flavobacteriales bacterium]